MRRFLPLLLTIILSIPLLASACSQGSDSGALKTQNASLTAENATQKAELESTKASLDSLQAEFDVLKASHDSLTADYEAAKAQSGSLASEYASLKTERDSFQTALDSLQAEYQKTSSDIKQLEANYQSLMKSTQQSTLQNPTWQQLQTFVLEDKTDTLQYVPDQFVCTGFAITLRDHAWLRGFRSALVSIGFVQDATGHALDAFQTTDKGLIYIDPQDDEVAYVEKGKIYGTVPLLGVKGTFINCGMNPSDFWKTVTFTQYSGNIFGYGYYQNYSQRKQFYQDSVQALNNEVDRYNAAIEQEPLQYSDTEIQAWYDRLNTWRDNLNALLTDLGSSFTKPMDTVSTIETYWD